MSLTAFVWFALFCLLAVSSLARPVYAAHVYLMTFFASPVMWWFGGGILSSLTARWNLVAAIILALANFMTWQTRAPLWPACRRFLLVVGLISINAFIVNSLLADYPPQSDKVFDILWKGCLASALVLFCLRSLEDLHSFLFAVVLGCGFVGYEIVLAGQGSIEGGRLEGFQFPGAQGANAGAAVLSLGLILSGYFVISMQNRLFALGSLLVSPLILESILRCNSRGAFLGLLAAGVVVLTLSRGESRKRAWLVCGVGVVAILLFAQDVAIWERFASIFAEREARDQAASERLMYWESAVKMILDYPFGSGGEAAFTSPRGVEYIQHFRPEFRSVHNGILDITASWGFQGLFLLLIALGGPALIAYRASKIDLENDYPARSFLGAMLLAVLADQIVCSMFTSILDGEWFLWLAVCCLVYARTVEWDSSSQDTASEADDLNSSQELFSERPPAAGLPPTIR